MITFLRRFWHEYLTAEKGYATNPAWRDRHDGYRSAPLLRMRIALATIRMQAYPKPQTLEEYLADSMPNVGWRAYCAESERVRLLRLDLVVWKKGMKPA